MRKQTATSLPGPRTGGEDVALAERRIPDLPTITDLDYERARLAALERYHVLDSEPERDFDDITALAAYVCDTEMALITLIEADRQWYKARLGVDICSTDREVAFCDYAVQSRATLVVPDATLDPRFKDNPFVTGRSGSIRFYAGAPLITPDGYVLGTLCVLGTNARDIDAAQLRLLEALAHQTMIQLEQRRQAEALADEVARRELAGAALARRQQFDEAVMEAVSAGVVACDAAGRVVLRNAVQRRLTGRDERGTDAGADGLGPGVTMTYADGSPLPAGRTPLMMAMAGQELDDVPMRLQCDDGSCSDVLVTARRITAPDGAPLGAVAALADITAERAVQAQLRESAAFHDAVLTASPDVIYTEDPRTHALLWTSRSLTDLLGYSTEDVIALGADLFDELVHPDDVLRLRSANDSVRDLADGAVVMQRYRVKHKDGSWRWFARRITPFTRDADGPTQVLGVARDVTDVVEVEERLREAALHDALTGLPNRTLLMDRLTSAIARCGRTDGEVAVLFCDLDGFKAVNDSGGHEAGDEVLRVTADRLRSVLRVQDTVARIGGDEFVVVLEPSPQRSAGPGSSARVQRGLNDPAAEPSFDASAVARAVAERVNRVIALPIRVGGTSYSVSASLGIALADRGSDPAGTLRAADTAMYRAKDGGKDRLEFAG